MTPTARPESSHIRLLKLLYGLPATAPYCLYACGCEGDFYILIQRL
uniref:Uncharacterized protein n=1 Tax=Anguilla anguilla TaxID=7936 RepID=A0A0E9VAW2_ANGAN